VFSFSLCPPLASDNLQLQLCERFFLFNYDDHLEDYSGEDSSDEDSADFEGDSEDGSDSGLFSTSARVGASSPLKSEFEDKNTEVTLDCTDLSSSPDKDLNESIGLTESQMRRLYIAVKSWGTKQEQIVPDHQHQQDQQAGRGSQAQNTSKFVGVSYDTSKSFQKKPWKAQIQKDRKKIHIGWYSTDEAAARGYDNRRAELGLPRRNFPTASPPEHLAQRQK